MSTARSLVARLALGGARTFASDTDCACCFAPEIGREEAILGAFIFGLDASNANATIAEALCEKHAQRVIDLMTNYADKDGT